MGTLPPNFSSKQTEDSVGGHTRYAPSKEEGAGAGQKGRESRACVWMVTQGTVGGLPAGQTETAKVRLGGPRVGGQVSMHWQLLATNISEPS